MILIVVFSQIPTNIVFVKKIIYSHKQENSLALNLLFSLIVSVQGLVVGLIFASLGWCQKVYHSPDKFIPRLMLLLTASKKSTLAGRNTKWLPLVFKYNDLYGRLLRGPKFALSVGTLNAITYFSSLEVSI